MTARTQLAVPVLLCLLLAAGFYVGLRAGQAPAAAVPQERPPLPAELRDVTHLAPAPLPIERPPADWDTVTPPGPPTVTLASIDARKPVLPALPGTEPEEVEPQYTPIAQSRLSLKDLPVQQLSRISWSAGEALHGAATPTPVLVARGSEDGQTLCVTAAVHGDELNGIEAVRQLMYSINVKKLHGTLVGVPIVNLQGFQRHSRYLSDRRDLNRHFPGNPRGSVASRMAYGFFNDIIRNCDGLVDLHTGSFHRTNLPQLRADLNDEAVLALTRGFGATTILYSQGGEGTLRRAAVEAGIPAVTLEAGEPLRLQKDAIDHTVKALFTLMDTLGMYNKRSFWGNPEPTYYQSFWVRADQGGMLFSEVKLGKRVRKGELLGRVTDPITNEMEDVLAPFGGRVIGMAVNQFVMPGYAAYHLAAETSLDEPMSDDQQMDVATVVDGDGEDSE